MKRSVNEITGEYRKALTGAGYPLGIAQDGAMAAACLQLAGLDSAAAIAEALPASASDPLSQTLPLLPSLYECVLAGEGEMSLEAVDVPLLAIGMGIHLAGQHECAFNIALGGLHLVATSSGIVGDTVADNVSLDTASLRLAVSLATDSAAADAVKIQRATEEGVEINEAHWPLINCWAHETYVPASEQSRLAGAGAGLNDND